MPLDPALKAVLDQLNAGGVKLHEVSPEQARAFFDAMQIDQPEVPIPEVIDRNLDGPAGPIPVRIYRPEQPSGAGLVYFHGGGWVIGSLETHDPICRELARDSGCTVISVDYRLAPEHPYPAAADDCYAATCWVAENAPSLGIDRDRLAVAGDSAGGNLAAVVSLMARDRAGPAIRYQLLIYPVIDADFRRPSYEENAEGYLLERAAMQWFWELYVPDITRRREAYAAPLHADDLTDLPTALVITAEYDPLRDEGEAYATRLESGGVRTSCVRYEGMIHGFFAFGMVAERAQDAVTHTCESLRQALTTA